MVPSPDPLLANILQKKPLPAVQREEKTKRENGDYQYRCAGSGWESKATDSLAFFTIFCSRPLLLSNIRCKYCTIFGESTKKIWQKIQLISVRKQINKIKREKATSWEPTSIACVAKILPDTISKIYLILFCLILLAFFRKK
jgi:hypothetical protein